MIRNVKKAIFPIAGLGTRFLPATKIIPKEMLIILDRPILEWAVIEASLSGIKEMIFVISSKKKTILEHFNKSPMLEDLLRKKKKINKLSFIQSQNRLGNFSFVIQDEPKGLGHAIWCAKKFIKKRENFAVILPDDIILSKVPAISQLIDISNKTNGGSVIALEKVAMKEVNKYGIIDPMRKIKNFYSIKNLIEKPKQSSAPSNLSVVGRYILNSKIFDYLDLQKTGHGNEIQLTDSLTTLVKNPGLFGIEFNGKRFDCGNKLGFIEANINFGLNDKEIKKDIRKILKGL
ncbi:MAG: UTP--glucose-1-phosphate uridylyltransferase [Pseudomonadota bacterium]|nr:UTP--glucose-1-phosphate uridylyltransferase [Pseudomonadota bacterium]